MRLRLLILLSALLVCLTTTLGCGSRGDADGESTTANADTTGPGDSTRAGDSAQANANEENDGEEEDDPVPVDVTVLERGSIEAVIRASANLEAESQVAVVAEAMGIVRELLVEEGDQVRKGQALVRLRDDQEQSALAKAETRLEKSSWELDRQKALREKDLSSDQLLSDAQFTYDQDVIAVADAKRALSYTRVTSPIGGTVTARMVNLGNQVQVRQELFQIVDFASIVARIYVPEKSLHQIAVGQKARVYSRALSPDPLDAKVLRISPIVDPRTGTIKVTVAVDPQSGLRPGLFADVELITATHENALLVPKRALVYDNDQTFVFRIDEERKVERLLVRPVLTDRFFIEPESGLAEGDSVVIAGQTGLKSGVKVRLVGEEVEDDDKSKADRGEDTES